MKPNLQRAVYWTPRVLGLLFAAFISLFALDIFDGSHGTWQTLLALAMHLIPTAILLGLLAASWRWEWIGAAAFPALGLLYIVTAWGRFHWSAYALIAGPLILLGVLFFLSWRVRKTGPPSLHSRTDSRVTRLDSPRGLTNVHFDHAPVSRR